MSKFLEAVEQNTPEGDLDKTMAGKRALQRFLIGKDIPVDVKTFRDILTITLDDGSKVVVEVKDYKQEGGEEVAATEDQETAVDSNKMKDMADTAASILAIKSPSLKDQALNPAARKIQIAKRTLADKIAKAAKKFEI